MTDAPSRSLWTTPAAFAALVVGSTFAVDVGVRLPYDVPKEYLVVAVVCVLLVAWAVRGLRGGRSVRISALEGLMAAGLATAVVGRPELLRGTAFVPLGLALLGVTFLSRQWVGEGASEDGYGGAADLVHVVWINGLALAMLGLRQAWSAGAFRFADELAKTPMTGTVGSPNAFAAVVALGAAAAFFAALSARSTATRSLLFGAAGVCVVAILANGSRGALLGLILGAGGAALLPATARKARAATWSPLRKVGVAAGAPALAVAVAVGLALLNPGSSGGRLLVWRISVPMVLHHPLAGVGAGGFGAAFPGYQAAYFSDPAHLEWAYKATWLRSPQSDLLRPFVETGIPGGMLSLLLWGGALVWMARAAVRTASWKEGAEVAVLGLLGVILVHGTVDSVRLAIPVAVVAHAVVGLVPAPALSWRPGRTGRIGLLVGSLVLAGLGAGRIVGAYPAQEAWLQGVLRGGAQGVPFLERAARALPLEGELRRELGQAQLEAGSPDEAAASLARALELGAQPEAGLELAEAQLANRRPEPARRAAKTYLAAYPDRLLPRLVLAKAAFALGDSAEARNELGRCLRRETHFRTDAVERVVAEAEALWRSHFDEPPPSPRPEVTRP